MATCQRRSRHRGDHREAQALGGVEGDGDAAPAGGPVELLERLPADARLAVAGDEDHVGHDARGLLLEGAEEQAGIERLDRGHLVDHVLARADLADVRPHVLREQDGEVVALAAHAQLRHLADVGELVRRGARVDGRRGGDALGLALERLQVLVHVAQRGVGGRRSGRRALPRLRRISRIGRRGGLLRRGEARLQAAEVVAGLVVQQQVDLLAQLLLPVLELGDLAAEDRHLALALAAPLLQRVHHLLRGVALRRLHLVGRRGPHLALRDLLEPLVDVVHGLAGVVLPHDPAEHVAQLRGEERRARARRSAGAGASASAGPGRSVPRCWSPAPRRP